MNAKDLFPTESERNQVKGWCDMFKGQVTKVLDDKNNILFDLTSLYHYDILHTDKDKQRRLK